MKNYLILLILFITCHTHAQKLEMAKLFQYRNNKVKSVRYNKYEKYDYEYREGLILEKFEYSIPMQRFYYYSGLNRTDSVLYKAIELDTVYITKDKYHYDQQGKLICIEYDVDDKQHIRLDSLKYDTDVNLSQSISYSNYVASLFRDVQIDSIVYNCDTRFFYDNYSRLIKIESNCRGSKIQLFNYDQQGRLINLTEDFGNTRHGCFVGENTVHSVTNFFYNDKNLLKREKKILFQLNPKGKKCKKTRYANRMKYQYY